ncbi:hypothetical protein M3Y97_00689500 [Aphelenchoides bicaudatus]|nr:hypothetical protein M3Y97_00689500 [Aphelenchoides bicaudatus]
MDFDHGEYSDEDMYADEAIEVPDFEEMKAKKDAIEYDQLVDDMAKKQPQNAAVGAKQRESKPRLKYTEFDLIGPKGLTALKGIFEDYKLPTDGKTPAC